MIYKLSNITFAYNGHNVVNIKNLEIEKGKIYIVSGSNGSGKTTLLKLLNGLLIPSNGKILFNNKPIEANNYIENREQSVFVHSNPVLLSGTVHKNIAYALKLRGKKDSEINQTVKEVLALVDLENFEERKSNRLSSGETKRVALARALALKPTVLLLDEPNAYIDKSTQEKINVILKEINNKHNTTVILSSHNSIFNEKIADKFIYIENGSIKN